jgi:hypothetical protein
LSIFDYFKQTFCSTQLLFSRVKPELSGCAPASRLHRVLLDGRCSGPKDFYQLSFSAGSHDNCAWHRTQFDARQGERLARIHIVD